MIPDLDVNPLVREFHAARGPVEQAEALQKLKAETLNQEDAALLVGKSQPFVSQRLRLLLLPPERLEKVRRGELSPWKALEELKASKMTEGWRESAGTSRLLDVADRLEFSPSDYSPLPIPKVRRGPWVEPSPALRERIENLEATVLGTEPVDRSKAAKILEQIFLTDFVTLEIHHLELRLLEKGLLEDGEDTGLLLKDSLGVLQDAWKFGAGNSEVQEVAARIEKVMGTKRFLEVIFELVRKGSLNHLEYLFS